MLGNFFVSNVYIKFREMSKKGLAADQDTDRQTDGVFTYGVLLFALSRSSKSPVT